jgi:hypothetical protein
MKRKLAATVLIATALAACGPNPAEKAAEEKRRLEFCKTVLDVTGPTDKLCGRFYAGLIAEKKAREQNNAREIALLPEKCKKYIGELMGRDPASMTINYERSGEKIVGISYARQDDGKTFKYECTINGNSIVWRGVDVFSPGEGPGRWRNEDAKALSSI